MSCEHRHPDHEDSRCPRCVDRYNAEREEEFERAEQRRERAARAREAEQASRDRARLIELQEQALAERQDAPEARPDPLAGRQARFDDLIRRSDKCLKVGDLTGASSQLAQAYAVQPDSGSLHDRLADVARQQGDPETELKHLKFAFNYEPTFARAAALAPRMRDPTPVWEALETGNADPVVIQRLLDALSRVGREDEAVQTLRRHGVSLHRLAAIERGVTATTESLRIAFADLHADLTDEAKQRAEKRAEQEAANERNRLAAEQAREARVADVARRVAAEKAEAAAAAEVLLAQRKAAAAVLAADRADQARQQQNAKRRSLVVFGVVVLCLTAAVGGTVWWAWDKADPAMQWLMDVTAPSNIDALDRWAMSCSGVVSCIGDWVIEGCLALGLLVSHPIVWLCSFIPGQMWLLMAAAGTWAFPFLFLFALFFGGKEGD